VERLSNRLCLWC